MTTLLLLATVALPLAMAFACLWPCPRRRMIAWLALAPLPGLAASLLVPAGDAVVLDARLEMMLALDRPAAVLLGVASLLWSAAGAYAGAYLGGKPKAGQFATCWLLTLAGSLGCFIAFDLVTFYLAFALASLPAYGLVVHDGTERAWRAGRIYLVLTLAGEVALLLGFVILGLGPPGGSVAAAPAVTLLPGLALRDVALAMLLAGLGLKAGLAPLHVWLPLAHPAAPMPASAVLSGAIVKAGVIGLIRFLPLEAGLADWGTGLTALGLVTAFHAVAMGITQANPKTVLAYSTVSQMGFVAAVLGAGLAAGSTVAASAAAVYAAHHVLAKGALFLAVGVAATTPTRRFWLVLLPATVLATGFGGMPFTGGAAAKLVAKPVLGEGVVAQAATLAGAGSTLLMLHFIHRLAALPDAIGRTRIGLAGPWLVLAVAGLVVPWLLLPMAGTAVWQDAVAPDKLIEQAWPVLLGLVLALLLRRVERRVPAVPEGDLVVLSEQLLASVPALHHPVLGIEARLQSWPVAGLALLLLTVVLGAAILGVAAPA
jgi:formate hydrogenlyase subunit 3/multisubunit Na+/H+ antiporter MnhD subunit